MAVVRSFAPILMGALIFAAPLGAQAVGNVSGGTFPGSLGADANEDGFVTAADLVAISRLLAP